MEFLLVLLVLYLVLALVVLPIWAFLNISAQRRNHDALRNQLFLIEEETKALRQTLRRLEATQNSSLTASAASAPAVIAKPPTLTSPSSAAAATATPIAADATPAASILATPPQTYPPTPEPLAAPTSLTPPALPPLIEQPVAAAHTGATSSPAASTKPVYVPPAPPPSWLESINWEQFMGAKLFAWLGGLALFLGVAFFVKYSFEHDLIPPAMRVAIGFLAGAGLIVGGLKIPRARYAITAQTLIAAGVVSLYAVTFACRSIYHFEFFGAVPTFLLMTLITATAFVLAVRLEAQVVAILGILGGFLTPVLINTGQDNPAGLFGYVALLNLGLIAVALHRRWFYLVPLGAGGTAIMMIGWAGKFYAPEKTGTAMIVSFGFSALFLGAVEVARRWQRDTALLAQTAMALPVVGFGFAAFFIERAGIAIHAGWLFAFILATDALLLALTWCEERLPKLHLVAGGITFALLSLWTTQRLTDELLPWALAAFLGFAALHTAFPLVLARRRPESRATWWSQLFPPLTLALMLLPIAKLDALSFAIWPAILLVDALAIGLALFTASLAAVAAVLVLTLLATGLCIFNIPAASAFDPALLGVIGFFAIFFFAAGCWLARKFAPALAAGGPADRAFGGGQAQLPAFASLLPFLLLILVCARLHVPDPSAVFGLGLLLVILTLGLASLLAIEWLPACALAGVAALQYAWHARHFNPADAGLALTWHIAFYAVFAVYPFLFIKKFARLTGPWAVAALSGVAHFALSYPSIKLGWPADLLGGVPALFALAPLASLAAILKQVPADPRARLNQLAWFGGVALFFITLIFPIQFERQWLTVAWALEGAALLWLFHRVPHPGLRATGAVLLVVAFVRLGLNPAVFGYHVRGDTAIFNWYLYTYGLGIAALVAGARLTAPPHERVLGCVAPPVFNALAVILAFLLLNIEIADYFTAPGARSLAFQFSGNFARDMSYTIGWALFALGLLGAGLWRKTRAARYTAIALLSVALLKLFFHDLARLEALYRIGALFAVAVIAIVASLAYQRFLPSHEKTSPPPR